MQLPLPHIQLLSETAWLIQFGTGFNVAANKAIHALAAWLKLHPLDEQEEVIPAYDSLLLRFASVPFQMQHPDEGMEIIEQHIAQGLAILEKEVDDDLPTIIQIPVFYDTSEGGDLVTMEKITGLPVSQIIALHCSRLYHVYLLGFLPGFCYMGELDEILVIPRKREPVQVKAGAVGIAGLQTGIYPLDSPGGWHIVGHTPLKIFDVLRTPASLVQPGMQVQFSPISWHQYQMLTNS